MARLGLGVTWLVGPLTGARFALGDTRLVRVEACLNQPRDGGELVEGGVIQFANRDAQAVNLGERRLAGYERPGDAAALFEQPIRVMARAKHGGLDCPCLARHNAAKACGRAAHQDAIRPEHSAVGIDDDAAALAAARMKPPRCREHRPVAAAIWPVRSVR